MKLICRHGIEGCQRQGIPITTIKAFFHPSATLSRSSIDIFEAIECPSDNADVFVLFALIM